MAAKENQGLQAIVIVLTIFLLLTGVGLLLVNNSRKTAVAQAADAQKQASDSQTAQAKLQAEANNYKAWIGFPEDALYDSLQPQFDADKAKFGVGTEAANLQYKTMLENVFEERGQLATNEANAKKQVKDLNDRLLAVEAQKEAQVKEHQAALQTAANDLAAERKKHEDQFAAMTAQNNEIKGELEKLRAEHDEAVSKLNAEKKALDATNSNLEHKIDTLREGLPEVDQFAQPADGEITYVNQRYGKVWINLGSADGLRPQVTFSVAAEGNADAEAAEKKGSIEVVRVLDAHMAEAQITSDDPKNPLLTGDRIYSQVWDRGRQVGFAIAGEIYIDKDGQSDLQRLKDIIAANNGRVDAAPDNAGAIEGELKVDTRYLVLGVHPEGTQKEDEALRESWKALTTSAEQLGIESIPLEEFVKLMGWRVDTRSVALDSTSRNEDFPPQPLGEQLPRKPVQPAGVFKKRLPGVNY